MATLKAVNKTKADDPTSDNIASPGTLGGRVRVLTDTITLAAASINDIIEIGQDLKAGAIILGIELQFAALGASTTLDVGDSNDDNRYMNAIDTSSASIARDLILAGLHYKIGTNSGDSQIILTLEGGAATGQVNINVYYTED